MDYSTNYSFRLPSRRGDNPDRADIEDLTTNWQSADSLIKSANDANSALNTTVTNHINNKNNPHEVTLDQLGGISADEVEDMVAVYESHVRDKNNPHETTAAQVGAYTTGQTDAAIGLVEDALETHVTDKNNPHGVTKAQVGLSNVDNTADANKTVSRAATAGLADEAKKTTGTLTITQGGSPLGSFDGSSNVGVTISDAYVYFASDAAVATKLGNMANNETVLFSCASAVTSTLTNSAISASGYGILKRTSTTAFDFTVAPAASASTSEYGLFKGRGSFTATSITLTYTRQAGGAPLYFTTQDGMNAAMASLRTQESTTFVANAAMTTILIGATTTSFATGFFRKESSTRVDMFFYLSVSDAKIRMTRYDFSTGAVVATADLSTATSAVGNASGALTINGTATGTNADIVLQSRGSTVVGVTTDCVFPASGVAGAYDVGRTNNRFRNGYFTGNVIGEAAPTAGTHLANKTYVDSVAGGGGGGNTGALYFYDQADMNTKLLAKANHDSGTFECASEVAILLNGGVTTTGYGRGIWVRSSSTVVDMWVGFGNSNGQLCTTRYNPTAGTVVSSTTLDSRYARDLYFSSQANMDTQLLSFTLGASGTFYASTAVTAILVAGATTSTGASRGVWAYSSSTDVRMTLFVGAASSGSSQVVAIQYNPTTSTVTANYSSDSRYAMLTGAQTIAGVKTFSSSPIVPTPTTNTQAANKQYVDSAIAGIDGGKKYTTILIGTTNAATPYTADRVDILCDGTNDTRQINDAINSIASVGGKIQLTDGTFTVASLSIPDTARRVTLCGQGKSTVLNRSITGVYAILGSKCEMYGFEINANGSQIAVNVGGNDCSVHQLYVHNAVRCGINVYGNRNKVYDCTVIMPENLLSSSMGIGLGGTKHTITGNYIEGSQSQRIGQGVGQGELTSGFSDCTVCGNTITEWSLGLGGNTRNLRNVFMANNALNNNTSASSAFGPDSKIQDY